MVSSKPVMPKTYSPADTTSTVVLSCDSSAKTKKNKLPLPKFDSEPAIEKCLNITDLVSNVQLPVATTLITGISIGKARDPRLTRDPRLASRDPRNQLQPPNRRVVINETNSTATADKASAHSSKSELTPKTHTISPSLLSNMRSLDAVKSHSNTHLATNLAKNKSNQTVPPPNKNERGLLNDKRIVKQDSAVDNFTQFKTSILTSEQHSNDSESNYSEANKNFDSHLRLPPVKFPDNTGSSGMVTAADFDNPFSPSLEEKNTSEQPAMEIINNTIDMTTDEMSNKSPSDSDDVQFLPNKSSSCNDKKDKPNDRNISRMRDRRRGSDDSDKGRRRDDCDSSRDRNRYGRDSRSGGRSRRDDDRRNRYRDDDYRDRNTDQFGRERRRKDQFNRRKDRYDDDEYDRYQRRRRDRSPMRNRSPENSSRWQQDNDRKSYKDSKSDMWKSSYDNSDNQLSNDSNQNKMGNLSRSPNSLMKGLHANHRHGSASPKDHPDDKSSMGKSLKRDRDYRENNKIPSPQGDRDIGGTSPKRICTDQGMESQSDRHNTKEDLRWVIIKVSNFNSLKYLSASRKLTSDIYFSLTTYISVINFY